MKKNLLSIFTGVLLGVLLSAIYFFIGLKKNEEIINNNAMSFSYAVKKSMPSVIYIYSDDCQNGVYGCPLGTGVIMDNEGHAVTNYHVTKNATKFRVMLSNNEIKSAVVIGYDKLTDIAVLEVNDKKLKPININPDRKAHVGDFVFAIGNPYNLVGSVSHGVISAIGRSGIGVVGRQNFIQTDVPINRGNSGGPLINSFGEMIGINSLVFNKTKYSSDAEGISFSLPINLVIATMRKIISDGTVVRGCIGVEASNFLLSYNSGDMAYKVIVTRILKNSQAEISGIILGDHIVSVDSKTVNNAQEALDILEKLPPGAIVDILIERAGNKKNFKIGIENCNSE